MAKTKEKLDWQKIESKDPAILKAMKVRDTALKALKASKEQAALDTATDAFETAVIARLTVPAGMVPVFYYRYGPSVAFTAESKSKSNVLTI